MREIVFRGKRIDNGEWVEGYYVRLYGSNGRVSRRIYTSCAEVDCGDYYPDFFEVQPATVGQYTGKTVKTGKVFDGDIGKSIDGIFLVCWDEEKAAFVMRFNEYPYETLYLEEMWDDAEVIGNIHDSPELMGVR